MNEKTEPKPPEPCDLRVWWIPQVPGEPFYVPVESPEQAKFLLEVLANYDTFQLEHNIRPDFSNAGGLEMFEEGDGVYSQDEWVDWYDEDSGEDIDGWQPDPQNQEDGEAKEDA